MSDINLGGTVSSGGSPFPIVRDTELMGGMRVVPDIATRDAIITADKKVGMLVCVQADAVVNTIYQLASTGPDVWVGYFAGALATWTGRRHYAVKTTGSDSNTGFGASKSAASTNAVQTLAKLISIIPHIGGVGQQLSIWIETGTYAEDLVIYGIYGYDDITLGATGDVTFAGAVGWSGSVADQTATGCVIATGTETLGYRVTGTPTSSVFDSLKVSDGTSPAWTLDAYQTAPAWVMFDQATPTVALRNYRFRIYKNTIGQITADTNLPAVPASGGAGVGDVFYLVQPGAKVQKFIARNIKTNNTNGFRWWGLDITSAVSNALIHQDFNLNQSGFWRISGAAATCSFAQGAQVQLSQLVVDDQGVNRRLGGPGTNAGISVTQLSSAIIRNVGTSRLAATFIPHLDAGRACNFRRGIGLGIGIASADIGGLGVSSDRELRCNEAATLFIGSPAIARFRGIRYENATSQVIFSFNSTKGALISIDDVTGDGSIIAEGVTVEDGNNHTIGIGVRVPCVFAPAVNNTEVAVRIFQLSALYRFTLTTINRSPVADGNGNIIYGTGGLPSGAPKSLITDSVTPLGSIMRSTTSGNCTLAQANSLAGASQVIGASLVFVGGGGQNDAIKSGGFVLVATDSDPTLPAYAFLSATTAGSTSGSPPGIGNYSLRLGTYVEVYAGENLALVAWNVDPLPLLV